MVTLEHVLVHVVFGGTAHASFVPLITTRYKLIVLLLAIYSSCSSGVVAASWYTVLLASTSTTQSLKLSPVEMRCFEKPTPLRENKRTRCLQVA